MNQGQNDQAANPAAPDEGPRLEGGTYEVIRGRLEAQATELRARLAQLNTARKKVFGSVETALLATERVTTTNNCVPRDIFTIGDRFIFGYNVTMGLKTETVPADVFSIYSYRERKFTAESLQLLDHPRFADDFREVYRYYKKAHFAKFSLIGPHLYMVFRVGEGDTDIKVFRWLVQDETLTYVDNRLGSDFRYPPQHEFEWTRTHRDLHRDGAHPHISIEDRVFVETVGGDLTIKVEDNTEDGSGIYAEPVENADQTLDDAEVFYAALQSLILLRIRPYQEDAYRYFVFNDRLDHVHRVDSIEDACALLPDGHGIVFSNGYYLQTGELKIFDTDLQDMMFERRLAAPNGEDVLFVFYQKRLGLYVLLSYNVIAQEVGPPIVCHGFTFFENGELLYFRGDESPQKHHAIQVWQTPYTSADFEVPAVADSYLGKVGNRDLVRGMAECHEILTLLGKDDSYGDLYLDLVKKCEGLLNSYHWIGHAEAFNLGAVLGEILTAAQAAVGEFDKVTRIRRETARRLAEVEKDAAESIRNLERSEHDEIRDHVASLAHLRTLRGEIISLRDLRYIDDARVETLEARVEEASDACARRCVEFLLQPEALAPYREEVQGFEESVPGLEKATDARELGERIEESGGQLQLLIEMVSNLKIDDASQRTEIIDRISEIFSHLNQVRAGLRTKSRELGTAEGIAEFNSQLKLLGQTVVGYLDVSTTPEKCDEFLTKLMVQLEELEGRFAEFDEFVEEIGQKRQEIYDAFEARKLSLIEARNKKAESLRRTADRILNGIQVRVEKLESVSDINSYFVSDLMVDKVRDLVEQLGELEDSVKADEIQGRLKALKENAVRQLKDRQELYVDGQNVIRFGQHRFSVNVQPLDLTTVMRDGEMNFHLTGTGFFEPITDPTFLATREVWDQEVVSENPEVYRAEYLAWLYFRGLEPAERERLRGSSPEQWVEDVQRFMAPRYHEGYVKGVHDHDAARIADALIDRDSRIGLLRYHPRSRALARFVWTGLEDAEQRELLLAKLQGFATIQEKFPGNRIQKEYLRELEEMLGSFLADTEAFDSTLGPSAAEYLFHELLTGETFCVSRDGRDLLASFLGFLKSSRIQKKFQKSMESVQGCRLSGFLMARDWVRAFLEDLGEDDTIEYVDEVAMLLLLGESNPRNVVDASVIADVAGLMGDHPRVVEGKLHLNFNAFMRRLDHFESEVVTRFHAYQETKKRLLETEREELRLDEFRPRVLTSFVRSRLIDEVYLPMIGDNLAKQMGVVGESTRTDRMGLLLLISPPGYGKTTLMEYVANRLGITFVKVNGPAIGHRVASLDPTEAPNASAREEVEKLNLALEMGDNIMIYLDDIQHCNPEFLQKFISLCDAQRKIEGVFKGKPRTYDLRGKKVAVVMAGNPYTESGERFQIPDMLANRADTYNLGDIIGDNGDAFKLSYLENALTSNPVLASLSTRSQQDVRALISMAEHGAAEGQELEGNYGPEELTELTGTLKKLLRVRDVVLAVNTEYIRSAGQSDDYRTEPAFGLQGSYRNMNKMAEKILPIMNDDEVEAVIFGHYDGEVQTLTTGAEANRLKFRELLDALSEDESRRWADIKKTYERNRKLRGVGDDRMGQIILQLTEFTDSMGALRDAVTGGLEGLATATRSGGENGSLQATFSGESLQALQSLIQELEQNRRAIAEQGTPEVNVVNKVPVSVLNVIRQQFEVMESWIGPILQVLGTGDETVQKLREDLERTRSDYRQLIQRLESGERDFG